VPVSCGLFVAAFDATPVVDDIRKGEMFVQGWAQAAILMTRSDGMLEQKYSSTG
jgi:hypothetical protein